ncbi:MAG: ATP-binding protein [Sulfurospirillaceae bacterium]|nr:ATP-binding protein [Sulfurospirillaceae bacterium]
MNTLEALYESNIKNNHFLERKFSIQSKKTVIYGPRKSGKSHIIFDHLSKYEKSSYLYIDFLDERINKKEIRSNLNLFVKNNPIKLLAIEHFDFSFELPKVEEIVLTSDSTCNHLIGFNEHYLYPLDFEEYLSFDKKHSNIEHLFNLYSSHGTFPYISLHGENNYTKELQTLLRQILPEEHIFQVYKKFCEFSGHKISFFQIYNTLKEEMKISKDKLYEVAQYLQETQLLWQVEKFNQPSSPKKAFPIDFAFKSAISFKKDFIKRFENMIFLELMKKEIQLFYTDDVDFYIPSQNTAVFCIPFLTQEFVVLKIKKICSKLKELDIQKVDVITIGNEGDFEIQNITCKLVPFWEWALQL